MFVLADIQTNRNMLSKAPASYKEVFTKRCNFPFYFDLAVINLVLPRFKFPLSFLIIQQRCKVTHKDMFSRIGRHNHTLSKIHDHTYILLIFRNTARSLEWRTLLLHLPPNLPPPCKYQSSYIKIVSSRLRIYYIIALAMSLEISHP